TLFHVVLGCERAGASRAEASREQGGDGGADDEIALLHEWSPTVEQVESEARNPGPRLLLRAPSHNGGGRGSARQRDLSGGPPSCENVPTRHRLARMLHAVS